MAATGTRRPLAPLMAAMAALLAVLACLSATPATAADVNFYPGEDCSRGITGACFGKECCNVPSDAASFQIHVGGSVTAFGCARAGCIGLCEKIVNPVGCKDTRGVKSIHFRKRLLKMATEKN